MLIYILTSINVIITYIYIYLIDKIVQPRTYVEEEDCCMTIILSVVTYLIDDNNICIMHN